MLFVIFFIVAFNILSLSLIFVSLITICLGVFIPPWAYTAWDSLCFLDWVDYFLSHVREIESHSVMSNSLRHHGLYSVWNSPGQNTGVGSFSLLQGLFSTQGLNPDLTHCRWILYQLSHKGSPRILEWVAYPFYGGSSRPRS